MFARRWWLLALVMLLPSLGACSRSSPPAGAPKTIAPRADQKTVGLTTAPDPIPADYVADRTIHLSSGPGTVLLGASPHPALQGTLAPLVVPSPDGRLLAYSTYTEAISVDPDLPPSAQGVYPGAVLGTPSILIHDLQTGAERTLADGAYSAAWRADGAIAYVQGSDPDLRANTTYVGQVVVRSSANGFDEQWTDDEGRYVVAAWAGRSLVVYHTTGNESFDLEVVDGPGLVRTLAPASSLLALSPDGARAAIATSANGRSSQVEIVDLATGEPIAILATDGLTSLVYGGSWVGSRLVARGGDDHGPIVDVFDVGPTALRLVKVLRMDARLPNGLVEPRLDPKDPNQVTAWSFVPEPKGSGSYVLVRCDLSAGSCTSGPPIRAKVVRLYSRSQP